MKSRNFDPTSLPGYKTDPLAQAAAARDENRVAKLIGTGAEPSRSMAHLASAALGDVGILRLLADNGANLRACDSRLRTAYELAHRHERFEVVRFFQRFEMDELVNAEGTPRWFCPYCWHWKFVGTCEDACEHYLTSTDMYRTSFGFAAFESLIQELGQRVEDFTEDGVDLEAKAKASKSGGARVIVDFLNSGDWLFWTQSPPCRLSEVTVDLSESLQDTTYTDYFSPTCQILEKQLERECKAALRWMEKFEG
jgi:hypothetical protein